MGLIIMENSNNNLEYKIKTLASLQLYAMEQDNRARRVLEKALLDAALINAREIFLVRVTIFLLGTVASFTFLDNLQLVVALCILTVFILHGALVSAQVAKAINATFSDLSDVRRKKEEITEGIKSTINL